MFKLLKRYIAKRKRKIYFANYLFIPISFSIGLVIVRLGCIRLPFLVFYTKKFIPNRTLGYVLFVFIFINSEVDRRDLSIITHEVIHLHQVFKTLGLHYILYNFSEKYRYKSELEAYSHQCLHLIMMYQDELDYLLTDNIIDAVVDIFVADFNFIEDTEKDKVIVMDDFLKTMIVLLKEHKVNV